MNFIKSATSEGLADPDGVPHSEYVNLYRQIARSRELSYIITGHIAVSRAGRPEPCCVYLTEGESYPYRLRMRNLKRAVDAVHSENASVKFIGQLNHGGRQIPRVQMWRNGTKVCISQKSQPVRRSMLLFKSPNVRIEQCKYIRDQFVAGAAQLRDCGFDGVQIHCAHGYLLHDCIEDGGAARRFVIELLNDIREDIETATRPGGKRFELLIKVPAEEAFLEFIEEAGKICDLIELSKGSYSAPMEMIDNHASKPALQFVDEHPQLLQMKAKICVTGGFHTKEEGNAALISQSTHFVGFGRLYCLPEQTKVERIRFGHFIDQVARAVPLINAGPATVFYEETLRRRAKGIAGTNKQETARIGILWWLWCLILWVLGFQRYYTVRDMKKK